MKKLTNNELMGNRLHEVMTLWENGIIAARNGWLMMGKAIHLIKKEKIWRIDIEHMPTFKYWVEHRLHISVAQAHRLSQLYEEIGHIAIDIPVEITKVTLLLPYMKDKTDEEKKEMIMMASECSIEDIKNNIADMNGMPERATDVCTHADVEVWRRCKFCGRWMK